MPKSFLLAAVLSISVSPIAMARVDEVVGTARSDGKIVYIEKHKVEYSDDGKLLTAETRYESQDGKLLANLKSDFTTSLTVPDHIIEDNRTGDIEGLRREGDQIVLFDHEKGKVEKTRVLDKKEAENRILIGCQGLNYYVLGHLDSSNPIQSLPLRFLIPGKLDYYDFDMKEVGSSELSVAEFEISIKNWFLKMFAPKLRAKYDRSTKRLIWYQGISNIKNEKGENQNVTIDYSYNEKH